MKHKKRKIFIWICGGVASDSEVANYLVTFEAKRRL